MLQVFFCLSIYDKFLCAFKSIIKIELLSFQMPIYSNKECCKKAEKGRVEREICEMIVHDFTNVKRRRKFLQYFPYSYTCRSKGAESVSELLSI